MPAFAQINRSARISISIVSSHFLAAFFSATEAAWRALLDDLVKRGLKTPELVIVDGAPGLEKALAALWSGMLVQRCTVHKHRNLLGHAPDRLHEQISADYNDMIYADSKQEVETKRKAFIRKWRLKCRAVAVSLEEAGDKLSPSHVSRQPMEIDPHIECN